MFCVTYLWFLICHIIENSNFSDEHAGNFGGGLHWLS